MSVWVRVCKGACVSTWACGVRGRVRVGAWMRVIARGFVDTCVSGVKEKQVTSENKRRSQARKNAGHKRRTALNYSRAGCATKASFVQVKEKSVNVPQLVAIQSIHQ